MHFGAKVLVANKNLLSQ